MPAPSTHSILIKKENAHDSSIYCCAWSKIKPIGDSKETDKEFIVTGGLDCLIKVWKLENNKLDLKHILKGHEMAVVSVAISPDGHTLASASMDSTLIIWDLLAGIKVHEIQTESTDVWQVAFSPNGTEVVSGSHKGKLTIYGIEKGTTTKVLDARGKFVSSVAWSGDGKYIASGAADGVVSIFDVAQSKLLHTIDAHTDNVRSVSFSPNSQLLVTAASDRNVKIFAVASASLQSSLEHKTWVRAMFAPDGKRVATADADGGVHLAATDSAFKLLHTFNEHTNMVCGIHFNCEGNKLVSVSKDKCIIIFECPPLPKNTGQK